MLRGGGGEWSGGGGGGGYSGPAGLAPVSGPHPLRCHRLC